MAADRSIRALLTQTGNDTFTSSALLLPQLDGKSAYEIYGLRAYWWDGNSVASGDWYIHGYVSTSDTVVAPDSDEWIVGCSWGLQNTGGVAVAVPYEPQKETMLAIPRLTVQPYIYIAVSSASTGVANDVYFDVYYSVQKMTELEYLRMLAGGA